VRRAFPRLGGESRQAIGNSFPGNDSLRILRGMRGWLRWHFTLRVCQKAAKRQGRFRQGQCARQGPPCGRACPRGVGSMARRFGPGAVHSGAGKQGRSHMPPPRELSAADWSRMTKRAWPQGSDAPHEHQLCQRRISRFNGFGPRTATRAGPRSCAPRCTCTGVPGRRGRAGVSGTTRNRTSSFLVELQTGYQRQPVAPRDINPWSMPARLIASRLRRVLSPFGIVGILWPRTRCLGVRKPAIQRAGSSAFWTRPRIALPVTTRPAPGNG